MIFFQTIFMNFGLLNFYYKKGIISLIFLYFHNIFFIHLRNNYERERKSKTSF